MLDDAELMVSEILMDPLTTETTMSIASEVIELLKTSQMSQMSLAMAESLTGGKVTAALTQVPGASSVIRGGIITYATPLKHTLLGVESDLIVEKGVVDKEVAIQMARGVRAKTTVYGVPTTWGLSTTGVAGPEPQDGKCVGTVYIGLVSATESHFRHFQFRNWKDKPEMREKIRNETTKAALGFLREKLRALSYQKEAASISCQLGISRPELGIIIVE